MTGGGFKSASGTGWPFSTIIRTVLCMARLFEKLKYKIIPTTATGRPKMVKKTMSTIGITIQGGPSESCPE